MFKATGMQMCVSRLMMPAVQTQHGTVRLHSLVTLCASRLATGDERKVM